MRTNRTLRTARWAAPVLLLLALAVPAAAQDAELHRVTMTNVTANQIIGPPVLASHSFGARIFRVGTRPSADLAAVAEDADSTGLVATLQADPRVLDIATGTGPILPGQSATFDIMLDASHPRLSAVGMLVTTNDAFFGLDSFITYGGDWRKVRSVPAYDAGSEANNEDCDFIPGPPCGNPGVRATAGAEGFVHVHPGIYGVGDLAPSGDIWLNPSVTITTVRLDN